MPRSPRSQPWAVDCVNHRPRRDRPRPCRGPVIDYQDVQPATSSPRSQVGAGQTDDPSPRRGRPALISVVGSRKSGPLFATPPGRPETALRAKTSLAGIPGTLVLAVRNLHQLWHSVATALISAAVPVGDVARFLGDTIAMIVRTYLLAAGADPARALDELFQGGRKVGSQTAVA